MVVIAVATAHVGIHHLSVDHYRFMTGLPRSSNILTPIDEKVICTKHKINHIASRLNNHLWSLPAISIQFTMMALSTALSFFTLQLHRPAHPHSPVYV